MGIDRQQLERKSMHFQSLVRLETVSSDDLRANLTLAHFFTKEDGMLWVEVFVLTLYS